jgi:hypothetical protein
VGTPTWVDPSSQLSTRDACSYSLFVVTLTASFILPLAIIVVQRATGFKNSYPLIQMTIPNFMLPAKTPQ